MILISPLALNITQNDEIIPYSYPNVKRSALNALNEIDDLVLTYLINLY